MMDNGYDTQLSALQKEIQSGGARPIAIDVIVDAMLQNRQASTSADLLLTLSDDAKFDEGMFSIIHAAESIDDDLYVNSLLSVYPTLATSAPRWASIILMRVLNNHSTQHALMQSLRVATIEAKQSIRSVCDRIVAVNPKFLSKTTPVYLATM